MLAHLSLPLAKSFNRPWLLGLTVLLGLSAGKVLAADAMPLGSLDTKATGNVSSGDTQRAGQVSSSFRFEGNQAAASGEDLQPSQEGEDKTVLRDANKAGLFLGAALTSSMELSLGVHGTFEHVRPEDRDQLFPAGAGVGKTQGQVTWRENLKETGFATASLMLKMKVLDAQGLKLAFAPFIESGAGEQATYSLTRSVSPKAGWMTAMTYGSEGVAEASLNGGYRYRNPEELGELTLRNELFYRASLKAYASKDFALFVAGDARKIMVARNDQRDDEGKLSYKPFESGQAMGGFEVKLGDADLQAFYGAKASKGKGFSGFGVKSFGAAVAWSLGNYKGRSSKDSIGSDIQKEVEADEAAKAKKEEADKAKVVPAKNPVDEYPEMIGKDIDPLDALAGDETGDFKDANKRAEQYKKDAAGQSEDERIEKELKQIKETEEKATKEREAQEKIEQAEARKKAAKEAGEDEKLMKEWMDEAAKDNNEAGTITGDEMEWNGLE